MVFLDLDMGIRGVLKNKRGVNILSENVIFISLNIILLFIILASVYSKIGGASSIEERYAKGIALVLDSAISNTEIMINMEDAIKIAKKEKFDVNKILIISENIINVKTSDKGKGFSYAFFSDYKINSYLNEKGDGYVLVIEKK